MHAIIPMEYGCGKSNVIVWNSDINENLIGARKKNHFKELIFYTVEFDDGKIHEYAVNLIAENMYVRVNGEGWEHLRMSGIMEDNRNDYTVRKEYGFINQGPIKNWRKTTKVWKLLVTWKYRISAWYNLNGLKESNTVEVT